jgi:hypothetical protein
MTKHKTYAILKGDKVLDVNKYLIDKQDDLDAMDKKFNKRTATDTKFFREKELQITAKQELIREMLAEMDCKDTDIGNHNITLIVSRPE